MLDMDNWNPYGFEKVQIFGTDISAKTNLCASDHYGVAADIWFEEKVRKKISDKR